MGLYVDLLSLNCSVRMPPQLSPVAGMDCEDLPSLST